MQGAEELTGQTLFNIYCYVVVGFVGNAIIGWELGRKGFVRVGLEGPYNTRLSLVLGAFVLMLAWQAFIEVEIPFSSWQDAWMPLWGLTVMGIAHYTVPRSMRIYGRAKFLQEHAGAGDWRKHVATDSSATTTPNQWLDRAQALYHEALLVQEQLALESRADRESIHHGRNIAVVYAQLSLLYLQKRSFEEAAKMAAKAESTANQLLEKLPDDEGLLNALSDAYFYAAEADEARGNIGEARTNYERSREIEERLGNGDDLALTRTRLIELAGK